MGLFSGIIKEWINNIGKKRLNPAINDEPLSDFYARIGRIEECSYEDSRKIIIERQISQQDLDRLINDMHRKTKDGNMVREIVFDNVDVENLNFTGLISNPVPKNSRRYVEYSIYLTFKNSRVSENNLTTLCNEKDKGKAKIFFEDYDCACVNLEFPERDGFTYRNQ